MDDSWFQPRAVDHPGTVTCPHCAAVVELPKTEPWLVIDDEAVQPEIESLPCSQCGTLIDLLPANDETGARDEEWHALDDEDN